ncbi:uncharacterized protein [Temnothorax nylanderi]|uniref:uncharacterized protein n=1 Tax=Temnothorax nylanderi TaxID=102681 RepID=UPI003A8B66E5
MATFRAHTILTKEHHKNPSLALRSSISMSKTQKDSYYQEGLELVPTKSCCIVFTRKRTYSLSKPNIQINGESIPMASEHRFLGIIIDNKLSGKPQLQYLINKGRRISSIIMMLAGTKWGSHPYQLLTIYRAVFRGAIEYGATVFQFKGNKQFFLTLQRLQWKLIRNAMEYRTSTPINVMLDEAKEAPLSQRFAYLIHNYLVKCFSCRFNPVIESLENVQLNTIGDFKRLKARRFIPIFGSFLAVKNIRGVMHRSVALPFFSFPFFSLTTQPELLQFFLPNRHSASAEEANQHFINHFRTIVADSISFYTDGSKLDSGAVGASVFSPDLPIEIGCKLPPDVTTFSAEAWAIYKALFIIHQLQIPSAIIFSDCKSVLQAITSHNITHNNYITSLIRNMFYRATTVGANIRMAWIPSHKGIVGNEREDSLAKEAAVSGRKSNCSVPYSDLYHRSKSILKNSYESYLENAAFTKGNFYYNRYHSDSKGHCM